MSVRFLILILVLAASFNACKTKKNTTYKKQKRERVVITKKDTSPKTTVKDDNTTVDKNIKAIPKNASYAEIVAIYIANYSAIAKQEMQQYGIPASITLAQGILESGAGRGKLTLRSNNHFGIKCHSGWKGKRVYHDDDKQQECFRKYTDPRSSFKDHSQFLATRSRYKNLFKLDKRDYKGWAKGLRKAGYATDPKYPQKLIAIIEKFELNTFDNEVIAASSETQSSNIYIIKKGDTLYSIAKRFNTSVETLKKINSLSGNSLSIGQVIKIK